ncbi:MAG: hypothetical protein ACLU3F_10165 [Blautia wexlerae]
MGISGHAAFPDGTQNAIGILCGKLKMQNLSKQTKRALNLWRDFQKVVMGKKQKFVVLMNVPGRLTCNIESGISARRTFENSD